MVNGLKAVIALLFGILLLQSPDDGIVLIALYFGIFALVVGAISIIFAFRSMKIGGKPTFWFIEGILNVLIGIIIIAYPQVTAGIFIFFVGLWAITISILQLISYNRYRKLGLSSGFMLVTSIISLIVGLLLLFNPFGGAKAVVLIIGIYAIFYGLVSLIQAIVSASESHSL
jgi:uncharacterized membrane protein HdeD (DUF308 family)